MSDVFMCDGCGDVCGGQSPMNGTRSAVIDQAYGDYRDVIKPGEFDLCKSCAKEVLDTLSEVADD